MGLVVWERGSCWSGVSLGAIAPAPHTRAGCILPLPNAMRPTHDHAAVRWVIGARALTHVTRQERPFVRGPGCCQFGSFSATGPWCVVRPSTSLVLVMATNARLVFVEALLTVGSR